MRTYHRFLHKYWTVFCLCLLVGLSLVACSSGPGNANANNTTPTPTSPAASSATPGQPAQGALSVTGVDIGVNPSNLGNYACGTQLTVTYTATFHFPANNAGGHVAFEWTTNNGRSSTQATLTVSPGATSVSYPFTWSGQLPSDHTQPGPGGIIVSTPNALTSQLVAPAGACTGGASTAFKVTSIDLSASPSLNGHACGSQFTETYTATFHFPANNAGGQVVFEWTTDNGRGTNPATLTIPPGTTSRTYTFTWKGALPGDHTAPGIGMVLVLTPNAMRSPSATPAGMCS